MNGAPPARIEPLLFALQAAFLLAAFIVAAASKDAPSAQPRPGYPAGVPRPARGAARASLGLASAALVSGLASAVLRTALSGRPPFASLYEFGLLLSLVLAALAVAAMVKLRDRAFSLAALGAAFVCASGMLLFYEQARPLAPALKSAWLGAHVCTAVVAYGCLALSAAFAVLGLASPAGSERAGRAEAAANRLIAVAFPFLTLLIVTGAVWAEYAWGSFWRWDPKETWALVTWLVYLVQLHLVRTRGLRGRRALVLAAAGFAVVLFTFFGVNFLLAGLHSYA